MATNGHSSNGSAQILADSESSPEQQEQEKSQQSAATSERRQKPTKVMPTNRIAFHKQLDLLRAYAIISGPTMKPINHSELADVVGISADTISLASPFFCDMGLLIKTDNSKFLPSEAVQQYGLAWEWNKEQAAHKLAPIFKDSWFGNALLPPLRYKGQMGEDEAIQILAEEAKALRQYTPNLKVLLEYLQAAGLITREGGKVAMLNQASPLKAEEKEASVEERDSDQSAKRTAQPSVSTGFTQQPEGLVQFHVSIRLDMAELSTMSPERITALFSGLAQVLAAKGSVEQHNVSQP